ncbi:hypothetical protein P0F65_06540 [Sphingomonas sp. I4]
MRRNGGRPTSLPPGWGPPPPPPPSNWGGPQYGGYDGGRGWRDAGYGYRPYQSYRPNYRCWTEYRGWERGRICR